MKELIKPLVSVVIIVKNRELFIRSAIQSVFDQDYRPIEVIVVDGKSEDNTLNIVREFEEVNIITQEGSGIFDAFNIGVEAANADFVAFLSSDDMWMPEKLTIQMNYLLENPEVIFTNSFAEFFLDPESKPPKGIRKEWLTGAIQARNPETLVARKEVFKKVGLFNTDLSTAEDIDWFSRAHDLQIHSHMIKKVLLKKRIHDSNASLEIDVNNKNLMIILRRALKRKKLIGDQ